MNRFVLAESKKNFLSSLNTNEDSQTQLMLSSEQLSPQLQHDFTLPEKNPIAAAIEKRYVDLFENKYICLNIIMFKQTKLQ